MGYAHKVAKITINGSMFGGLEHWSTGFYMGQQDSDASPLNDQFMSAVNTAWQAFFTAASSKIGLDYKTTSIRASIMNSDGLSDKSTIKNFYPPTEYTGAGGPSKLPPQCALVATLTTSTPRGLGSKGRMYLPGISASVDSTGHIATADTLAIANNLKTFFLALNSSFDQPGFVVTASQGSKVNIFNGPVNRIVTGVKVGNVYDTQRRRRNELVEAYSAVAI